MPEPELAAKHPLSASQKGPMGEKCSERKTLQKTIGNPVINRSTLKHQLDAH